MKTKPLAARIAKRVAAPGPTNAMAGRGFAQWDKSPADGVQYEKTKGVRKRCFHRYVRSIDFAPAAPHSLRIRRAYIETPPTDSSRAHLDTPFVAFRARPPVAKLYPVASADPAERRRRSARLTRLLRLLRGHGLLEKLAGTHRYQVGGDARTRIQALLACRNANPAQLIATAA
jgi:hypothetical protein